jgi:hypothetical protein
MADAKAVITQAANAHGISPAILWGVFGTETNYGSDDKTSSAGAEGDLQLEPSTAASLGVKNPNNLVEAANGAAKYLAEFKGRGVGGMLSAYNAGPAGGYQAGYVNDTLKNAASYGSGADVSVPTVAGATISASTPSTTIPGKPARTETSTVANPRAQGLSMLESLIRSEKGGGESPLISTGVLAKAAAPVTNTKVIPGTPGRTIPGTSGGTQRIAPDGTQSTATGVPVTAQSAAAPNIKLPNAAPPPNVAARAIHAPALPKAVEGGKRAMEAERHHPVSLPELEHALTEAEHGHGVVETPAGKVVKTGSGPVFVPKRGLEHGG